jgi:head-tail adaptor
MIGKKTTMVLSSVVNGIGTQSEVTESWSDLEYLTGTLQPISGREQFVDGKWRVKADFAFFISPSKMYDIDESYKLRIPSEQREFDIVGVIDTLEQGTFLKLELLERR